MMAWSWTLPLLAVIILLQIALIAGQPPRRRPPVNETALLSNPRFADVPLMRTLSPLMAGHNIMFWRLQKVGSSTMLSMLLSYAYRYHFLPRRKGGPSSFCRAIAQCALATRDSKYLRQYTAAHSSRQAFAHLERLAGTIRFKISLNHEICNLNGSLITQHLSEAFAYGFPPNGLYDGAGATGTGTKEIFMVREPLARMVSVYYFWGELFKMEQSLLRSDSNSRPDRASGSSKRRQLRASASRRTRLGDVNSTRTVRGPLFTYHGSEHSAPSNEIAMAFAQRFPYRRGFPGPSLSSSAFSSSVPDALAYMTMTSSPSSSNSSTSSPAPPPAASARMLTIVLERLDESLVVLAHHLQWTLADVIVTTSRKALSSHPKVADWPQEAVQVMRAKLEDASEYAIYELANRQLTARVEQLKADQGVDVQRDVQLLRALRKRVAQICSEDAHLDKYKLSMASAGLRPHPSQNKLRDFEDKYLQGGHIFSFNGEILCSVDLCASCEAHALLASMTATGGTAGAGGQEQEVSKAQSYFEIPRHLIQDNLHFRKCPARED